MSDPMALDTTLPNGTDVIPHPCHFLLFRTREYSFRMAQSKIIRGMIQVFNLRLLGGVS